jgi:hypothetical protein
VIVLSLVASCMIGGNPSVIGYNSTHRASYLTILCGVVYTWDYYVAQTQRIWIFPLTVTFATRDHRVVRSNRFQRAY